jgi:hypothetical protein
MNRRWKSKRDFLRQRRMDQPVYQLLLKRFQETDEIADLPRIQPELGHARMTSRNPFAQRFFQRLDWISLVESSERRGNG